MKKSYRVVALAVAVTAALTIWFSMRGGEQAPVQPGAPRGGGAVPQPPTEDSGEVIVVRHRSIGGTHTWSGTLTTPTPCHQVSTDARVMESYPEQVVLSFTVREPEPGTVCAQVIAEQPFGVSVRTSEGAVVRGELNGRPVAIEVVEGGVEFEAPPLGVELVP